MKIKTYVVNLERSKERKKYIQQLLEKYNFLDIEFVTGIDGHKLTEKEINNLTDKKKTIKYIGHLLSKGEIGCSLSHQKCYQELINSEQEYALILEDDISIIKNLNKLLNIPIANFLLNKAPRVLFASGDYWYLYNRWKGNIYHIKKVFCANGTYAYFINRSAAKKMIEITPKVWNVADGWDWYSLKGVSLNAIYPYLIDANLNTFESEVKEREWSIKRYKMSIINIIISYFRAFIKNYYQKWVILNLKIIKIKNGKATTIYSTRHSN